jgi:hypothetical protein
LETATAAGGGAAQAGPQRRRCHGPPRSPTAAGGAWCRAGREGRQRKM